MSIICEYMTFCDSSLLYKTVHHSHYFTVKLLPYFHVTLWSTDMMPNGIWPLIDYRGCEIFLKLTSFETIRTAIFYVYHCQSRDLLGTSSTVRSRWRTTTDKLIWSSVVEVRREWWCQGTAPSRRHYSEYRNTPTCRYIQRGKIMVDGG